MDPSSDVVKQEAQKADEFNCDACQKSYKKEGELAQHNKIKHSSNEPQKQQKPKPVKAQPKNRMLQMQQNQHEDIIYAYLGELGEKHQEQSGSRLDIVITDENQKLTGQTNYSVNKVVRTPYEKQIDPVASTPNLVIEINKNKEFLKKLSSELKVFHDKIQLEKDKWEFRDPMAPDLMDIRKMINNYPRRQINTQYPHFSIFMLWIGRICKAGAWQQIFMIIGQFLANYYAQKLFDEEGSSKAWDKYAKKFEEEQIVSIGEGEICDAKTIKKLVEYFSKWVTLFGLTKFC